MNYLYDINTRAYGIWFDDLISEEEPIPFKVIKAQNLGILVSEELVRLESVFADGLFEVLVWEGF